MKLHIKVDETAFMLTGQTLVYIYLEDHEGNLYTRPIGEIDINDPDDKWQKLTEGYPAPREHYMLISDDNEIDLQVKKADLLIKGQEDVDLKGENIEVKI